MRHRARRHIVRLLADGRYVCKACPFSSRVLADAIGHTSASQVTT